MFTLTRYANLPKNFCEKIIREKTERQGESWEFQVFIQCIISEYIACFCLAKTHSPISANILLFIVLVLQKTKFSLFLRTKKSLQIILYVYSHTICHVVTEPHLFRTKYKLFRSLRRFLKRDSVFSWDSCSCPLVFCKSTKLHNKLFTFSSEMGST